VESKLYHLGFRGKLSRSTLADANQAHDWRIFADFAPVLLPIARPMYRNESLGFDRGRPPSRCTPCSTCAPRSPH
jgi:hypothetical protein